MTLIGLRIGHEDYNRCWGAAVAVLGVTLIVQRDSGWKVKIWRDWPTYKLWNLYPRGSK